VVTETMVAIILVMTPLEAAGSGDIKRAEGGEGMFERPAESKSARLR